MSDIAAPPPPAGPPPPSNTAWVGPVLWVLFVLLCAGIAYDLLRGCGVALPFSGKSGGLFLNYCPISASQPDGAQLRELQAQNAMLQSRLDRLLGGISGRREQCALTPPKPQPTPAPTPRPSPTPTPTPSPSPTPQQLTIPPVTDNAHKLKFLAGCWSGPSQLDNDNTPIDEAYCFDDKGKGTITISNNQGMKCTGPLKAQLVEPGPKLVIDRFQGAKCEDGSTFDPIVITCESDNQGETECSGKFASRNDQPFDISLHRIGDPPK